MKTDEGYMAVLNAVQELLESLKDEHSKEDFHDGVKDAVEQHGFTLIDKEPRSH